ncbi:homeobox protein Nkx-6.2 [Octopus bimaculoides]|uniref:homeobox protein Nkx-6.2 n=1 Tax=Octopus bimaculoides TaxID=37653 RepID=UPI0022E65EDB|nr:homeobox protein Nkx-6.2 [Octopus bimaculoides]
MLDYCSNESNSPGYQQNPSPTTMASLLNMNMNVNMETSRQTAFVLSNPPLAALHNMTEMKIPTSTMLAQSGYPQTSLKQLQGLFASQSTPHGINDILGRPANTTTNTAFGVPRLNTTAATGMYFTPQTRFPKLAELPGRQPIYWPGVLPGSWRPQGKFSIAFFFFVKGPRYI